MAGGLYRRLKELENGKRTSREEFGKWAPHLKVTLKNKIDEYDGQIKATKEIIAEVEERVKELEKSIVRDKEAMIGELRRLLEGEA